MQVGDIMTKNVIAVTPGDTAFRAAELMTSHNIGAVPVVDNGEVKGMLTDRDIVLRCVSKGQDPKSVEVSEIMTPGALFVSSGQSVSDAIDIMAAEQVRRLPVVDNGKLAGFLSFADIARQKNDAEIAKAISEISMP